MELETDIAIVGAGIAGLWIANRLQREGYSVLVIERDCIGGGQTIAAQGVIHGGLKYALNGVLSDSSEKLKDMPGIWRECAAGAGEVDLSAARLLADHQLLWSAGSMASALQLFFAGKALSSRSAKVGEADRPALLQKDTGYRGSVYRIDEPVFDVPSVLTALAAPLRGRLVKLAVEAFEDGVIRAGEVRIRTNRLILAAGAGNEGLMAQLKVPDAPAMQRRPLHQVLVRHPELPPLYSVCMGTGTKPVVVTTTHRDAEGRPVWYLGGDLAETGVERSEADQIAAAKACLGELLPALKLEGADWATFRVDRAEFAQADAGRPASVYALPHGFAHVVWPTKLALAPRAADLVVDAVCAEQRPAVASAPVDAPEPPVAQPIWEEVFS